MESKKVLFLNIVVVFFICVLLFLALFLLAATCFSYEQAKEYADFLAADGNFSGFNKIFFMTLSYKLRIIGLVLFFIVFLIFFLRRIIARESFKFISNFLRYFKELLLSLKKDFVTDSKTSFYWLLFLFTGGVGVRLFVFFHQGMRCDEANAFINYVNTSWFVSLCWYPEPNNHIFYSFLTHFSCVFFGNAPWAIRLPAFIAGSLLIPAAYITGKRMFNSSAIALLFSAFVAGSSPLVDFSTNGRGYTLITLLFLCCVVLAIDVVKQRSPYAAVLLAFVSAFGFFAIPTMIFPFGGICLWLTFSMLIFQPRKKFYDAINLILLVGFGAIVFTVILYLPAISVSGLNALLNQKLWPSKSAFYVLSNLWILCESVWIYWNCDIPMFMASLLACGVVLEVFVNRRVSTVRGISLSICIAIWSFFILLLRGVLPHPYMLLPLLSVYLMGAAAGFVYIVCRLPLTKYTASINCWGIISSVCFFVLCYGLLRENSSLWADVDVWRIGHFRRAESVAEFLGKKLSKNDVVTGCAPTIAPVRYYCFKKGIPQRHFDLTTRNPKNIFVLVKQGCYTFEDVFNVQEVDIKQNAKVELLATFDFVLIYIVNNVPSE